VAGDGWRDFPQPLRFCPKEVRLLPLLTIEGVYKDGKIELSERPKHVDDAARVLVTFLPPRGSDDAARIDPDQHR
jgi:hypothetical protein